MLPSTTRVTGSYYAPEGHIFGSFLTLNIRSKVSLSSVLQKVPLDSQETFLSSL